MKFSQPPGMPPGLGPSPGSIRNTLGSGLKNSGFFQKDGHIQNMRGGFIGPKQAWPQPGGGIPPQSYGQMPNQISNQGDPRFNPQYNPQYNNPYPSNINQPNANMMQNPNMMPNAGTIPNANIPNSGMQSMDMQSGGGKMGKGPFSFLGGNGPAGGFPQARQLVLQAAAEGIIGNGVATISPDNSFLMIANLPPPHTFQAGGLQGGSRFSPVYATYLVDKKGKSGFLAGVLSPVGNGVYRAQFRSQVPLNPYERVIVSVENPQRLGQAPAGPIILKVKEPAGPAAFFIPFKNAAGSVWGKIAGLTKRGVKAPIPTPEAAIPDGIASETIQETLSAAGSIPSVLPPSIPPKP